MYKNILVSNNRAIHRAQDEKKYTTHSRVYRPSKTVKYSKVNLNNNFALIYSIFRIVPIGEIVQQFQGRVDRQDHRVQWVHLAHVKWNPGICVKK